MKFPRFISRMVTFVFLSFGAGSIPRVSAGENEKLNVLFVVSDDLNMALGCYGNTRAKTPNLDRLAGRGVRFERAYCQYPVCGPSRASLLTGRYPNSTGVFLRGETLRETIPGVVTLPQAFRQNGYFAARVGKLFHYNVPRSIGTSGEDDPASWEMQINPVGVDRTLEQEGAFSLVPGNFGDSLSWKASERPAPEHTDGKVVRDALWVLERCAQQESRPFFLAVGFHRPHTPFIAPKEFFDLYPMEQIALAVEDEAQDDVPPIALMSRKAVEQAMTAEQKRSAIQAYLASVSFMDAQVGKLLDGLDRLNLTDRTVVVFTSDHGYHLGEHGLWQKRSLFEESARVPLIIAAPAAVQGAAKTIGQPVGLVDIYPTLAELCAIPSPDGLQGESLAGTVTRNRAPDRGWALTQMNRVVDGDQLSGYSIVRGFFRYTAWGENGERGEELYDHRNDPSELTNQASAPEFSKEREALSDLLKVAIAKTFPSDGRVPEPSKESWIPDYLNP